MAQLYVPIVGRFHDLAGLGFTAEGESLDRPLWRGAEIGAHDSFPDLLGAIAEAEFREWIIGVHHPLVKGASPDWIRFLDPDPAVRQTALNQADQSAQDAHRIGARYILFHFPWPGFELIGHDHMAEGWSFKAKSQQASDWTAAQVYEASRAVFERMSAVAARNGIQVVFEVDGPCPHFVDGELFDRLFTEYPDLSLCLDTGRIGLLAKTHRIPPLALFQRWLPWTSGVHLHTSRWNAQGQFENHLPTSRHDVKSAWPSVTPAAEMAKMAVESQPHCRLIPEHNPRLVSAEVLEMTHAWLAELVGEA